MTRRAIPVYWFYDAVRALASPELQRGIPEIALRPAAAFDAFYFGGRSHQPPPEERVVGRSWAMRAEQEWENPGSSGIQLWTVPVVLLALMMIGGGVRSVLTPGDGTGADAGSIGAPGLVSSHRYDGDGDGGGDWDDSGGARTGQRAAAGEQPVGRLGD